MLDQCILTVHDKNNDVMHKALSQIKNNANNKYRDVTNLVPISYISVKHMSAHFNKTKS